MIKTLNPYANTAKTAEIMSRYRPIAPKPEASGPTSPTGSSGESGSATSPSNKIKQSPYLRNLWPQMQARPTRARKRNSRAAYAPPASLKRQRTGLAFSPPPCHVAFMGFSSQRLQQFSVNPNLVTLPLLPCPRSTSSVSVDLDLNRAASRDIPEEMDLLQHLQGLVPVQPPVIQTVIAPQPVRPVGSTILVRSIREDPNPVACEAHMPIKKMEEVEAAVEAELLPAVISDSNYKVRMVNSAYKELVGQPECTWLGSMVAGASSKRIGGEVALRVADGDTCLPAASSAVGFSCCVRIEWGKKNLVNALCDVERLACESKDYVLTWRFHTRDSS